MYANFDMKKTVRNLSYIVQMTINATFRTIRVKISFVSVKNY